MATTLKDNNFSALFVLIVLAQAFIIISFPAIVVGLILLWPLSRLYDAIVDRLPRRGSMPR